ncbi:hypothetical protein HDU88_008337, partial [Geranomyces variabilis]
MLKRGDTIKRKEYGEALRAISEHGADVFYTVWIADELVIRQCGNGSVPTLDDMRGCHAK